MLKNQYVSDMASASYTMTFKKYRESRQSEQR